MIQTNKKKKSGKGKKKFISSLGGKNRLEIFFFSFFFKEIQNVNTEINNQSEQRYRPHNGPIRAEIQNASWANQSRDTGLITDQSEHGYRTHHGPIRAETKDSSWTNQGRDTVLVMDQSVFR